MCPPATVPPHDIREHSSEEELFMSLEKFPCGGPLPTNVMRDINPHHYRPENLPDLNSITRDGEASPTNRQANNIEAEPIVARDNPLNLENVPDADWEDFQRDYLEIDDLVIPRSPSSSSGNSSCLTVSSDECFESLLLQDIENEIIQDSEKKGADHTFNVASHKPDRIVTYALSPGSSAARKQEEIQTTWIKIAPSPNASAPTDKTAGQTVPKREIREELQNPDDIPSGRCLAASASTSNSPASTGKNTVSAKRWNKGRGRI